MEKTDAEIRREYDNEYVRIQSLVQANMHLHTFTARIHDNPMFKFTVYESPDMKRLKRKQPDAGWSKTSINGLDIEVLLKWDEVKGKYQINWDAMKEVETENQIAQEIETVEQPTELTVVEPKPLGLYSKMALIMGTIKGIGKKGKNQHFNYEFARAEDVTNVIRLKLSEHGIAFFASIVDVKQTATEKKTKSGVPYMKTLATFAFTFVDGETQQERTSTWTGEADDESDKGVNKASTAAEKYFLLKTFLIHTGDQPDADSEGARAWYDSQKQVDELIRQAAEKIDPSLNNEDAIVALLEGVELSNFPTRKEAAIAIKDAWVEKAQYEEPAVMNKTVEFIPTAQEIAAKLTDIDDLGKDTSEFLGILDEVWQDESIRNLYDGVFAHYENSIRKLMREGKFTENDTTALITEVIRAHKNGNGAWNPTNQEIMAISDKIRKSYKISLERVITLSEKKSLVEFGSEANVLEAAKALTTKQKTA